MVERRYQLPYEGTCSSFRESLLLEIVSDMRKKFSTLCDFSHQAVQVVGLHGLVQSDDVGVSETTHELGLTKKILSNIVFFDLIRFNNFYCNL